MKVAQPGDQSAAKVRRIGGIVTGLIVAGALILMIAAALGVQTLQEGARTNQRVLHTLEVQRTIDRLGLHLERGETSRRGLLLSADPVFRVTWEESRRAAREDAARLVQLVGDNGGQSTAARDIGRAVDTFHADQTRAITILDADGREAAQAAFRDDRSVEELRSLRTARQEMAANEATLLEERNAARDAALARFYAILAMCAVLVVAIVGTAVLVIRRYTRETAEAREALGRLNTDLEDVVSERTMELRRANEEIQRFAYIVSHDLRSPLVNVMGFTSELEAARAPLARLIAAVEEQAPDLMTREAKLAVEEDLPESVRFIRTSTEKMDRLINAILNLSRQGRRTLAPEPIDMTALVTTATDSLRRRIDEAGATVVVEPLPSLVTDRVAIDQIFSNLIENAVKYLQPGRPGRVIVRGRTAGPGRVVFEVIDNGRGIDPRDHQRVFDLFRRSGRQDQPGEGIGLAHVRSVVWRLGGTIELDSKLDAGATFRLSMPVEMPGEEAA